MDNDIQTVFDKKQYFGNVCTKTYVLCDIIDLCNQSCRYCYNKIPRSGTKLDLDKLNDFIVYLMQHEDKNYIEAILLGGEPTLHEDLFNFCENMSKLGVRCTIISNFSNDIDLYLSLLNLNNICFDFSWHSTYDSKTIGFIDKIGLLPYRCFEDGKIDITVMYEQEAHEQSLHIFNELSKKYRKFIDLEFVSWTQNNYTYAYTDEQLLKHKNAVENNKAVRQKHDNISFLGRNAQIDVATNDVMDPTKNLSCFKQWLCNAGKDQLYVHHNGDVAACPDMYSQKKSMFGNICSLANMKMLHCTLCQTDFCTCPFYAKKTKIFKSII